jgi:N-acetylmuramoyl-L-alanine amidase
MRLTGKVSWFGGPEDMGVDADEGLAFIDSVSDKPELFLPAQPSGTTGLARRLDPDQFYIATRWNYDVTSKEDLLDMRVLVRATTGKQFFAYPADWGPHEDTGRVADISPGLMAALGIDTDDEVEVLYVGERDTSGLRVVISSGHSAKVRGASGFIDEVDEARRVVNEVVSMLAEVGVEAIGFHDNTSTTQSENLDAIVDFHNSQDRDLDVSVHFNAAEPTSGPRGTECLYVTQERLAELISGAISEAGGLKDRGAKYRDDLKFLNATDMPAVLIEVCFVDAEEDCELYLANFGEICEAIARVIANELLSTSAVA